MTNKRRLIAFDDIFPNNCFYVNEKEPLKSLDELIHRINNAPTVDAVEVVRCKDCKKWEYDENFSGWCVEWRRRTLGDHFCSYGERREGG